MLYDLTNPSDDISFIAPSHEAAVLAVLMVGRGMYGAESEEGDEIPMCLDRNVDEYLEGIFGEGSGYPELFKVHFSDVLKTLQSFVTVSAERRGVYDKALELIPPFKRAEFVEYWEDTHRTSVNNITKYAQHVADTMRGANK